MLQEIRFKEEERNYFCSFDLRNWLGSNAITLVVTTQLQSLFSKVNELRHNKKEFCWEDQRELEKLSHFITSCTTSGPGEPKHCCWDA